MPFRILVLLGGAIATAVAGAIYPFVGLLALEFLTFGRPQDDRPNVEVLHIPLIMVVSIILGLLPRMGTYGPGLIAGFKRIWLMLALYSVLLASALANGWTILSRNRLYDFGTIVFLCLVTLAIVNSAKRLHVFLWMLMACGLYVAERVIRNPGNIFERIGEEHYERAAIARGAGNFGNSNFLALLMVLTISLAIPLMGAYRKWWQRIPLLGVVAACGYVFFRANSRGASMGLAVALLWMWITSKKRVRATVVAMAVVSIAAIAAPAAYWSRLGTILTYQEDASATTRLELWNQAWDLTAKNPILGIGPDNFALYSDSTPHDAYLQVACEAGVPAVLLYVAWLISGFWSAYRARQLSSPEHGNDPYLYAVSSAMFCCLIVLVVQGFTTGFAFREVVYGYVVFSFLTQRLAQNLPGTAAAMPERSEQPLLQRAYAPQH